MRTSEGVKGGSEGSEGASESAGVGEWEGGCTNP